MVEQTFGITYKVNHDESKPERSGNPGYLTGLPLLVGQQQDA